MIQNYFKTALRTLARNKSYTALNVAGLAVGIGACLLIFLVVQFELSFDNFHKDKDRIYRVVSVPGKDEGPFDPEPGAPLPVAQGLRTDFPQLEQVAAVFGRDGQVTVLDDRKLAAKKFNEENGVYFAEPQFFDIFSFAWLAGNPKTALSMPNTVILTRSTADKYFGDWKTATGRNIKFANKDIYRVTGILQDLPANTDFPLKVVVSYRSLTNVDPTDWVGIYGRGYTFVRLPPGLSAAQFDAGLHTFESRHVPEKRQRRGLVLQPLSGMHFDPRFGNYSRRTFSNELITSLSLTAAFLLIIACVNFVNLATAQAVNRSREVGVRKVLGSTRGQLIRQFLGEAGVITVLAMVAAVCLAAMTLPLLNGLLQTGVSLRLDDLRLLGFLGLVALSVTVLAGLYPAFVLSGFNPISSLKNKLTVAKTSGISLRRGLVVLQFCIAQVLIICVLVVSSQMNYFRHASLGFDKESIVNVPLPDDSLSLLKVEALRHELLLQPGIERVCFSTFSPLDNEIWSNQFYFDHSTKKTDFQAYFKWSDADFFKTYQPEVVAGRTYGPSDTLREFVVNETLVRKLGLRDPKEIIGKEIRFWDKKAPVVGVVKDFFTNSLQKPIWPIILGCWRDSYEMIGIKLRTGEAGPTMAAVQKIWTGAFPDYVYEYKFLDKKIDSYYKEEARLSVLYRVFAGIAIFISCLGLYGLVSFMAAKRTREIGVRKVLGASVPQIIYLLAREFTVLIGIAFLTAAPIAGYFMHRWLEGFTYRTTLDVDIFMLALAGSVLIAWGTVGYRAFRAAVANPVNSLRSE